MAQSTALGDGPVDFTTDEGQQVSIPLGAIFFDSGQVKSRIYSSDSLTHWLEYLVATGRLSPAPAPPAGNAMTVTAALTGRVGNTITVTVAPNNTDRTQVDITIVEADSYPLVTLNSAAASFVSTILGTSAAPGATPGIVRVKSIATAPVDPVNGPATAVTPVTGNPSWTILGPVPTAPPGPAPVTFTVEARTANATAGRTTVTVSNVQPAAGGATFALDVVWTNTVTIGPSDLLAANATALATKLGTLAFAVTIATITSLPAPGTYHLGGGAEAATATSATATIPASA